MATAIRTNMPMERDIPISFLARKVPLGGFRGKPLHYPYPPRGKANAHLK